MVSSSSSTSLSLLVGIRANEPLAWNRLVQLYVPFLQRWCYEFSVRQSSDVEDVIQEILIEVRRSVAKFDRIRTGSFRSWLKQITRTRCADFRRRHQRTELGVGGSKALQQIQELPDLNATSRTDESVDADAAERDAIWERAFQLICEEAGEEALLTWQRFVQHGDRAKDIASDLGVSVSSVYRNVRDVKRLIHERYDPVIEAEDSSTSDSD